MFPAFQDIGVATAVIIAKVNGLFDFPRLFDALPMSPLEELQQHPEYLRKGKKRPSGDPPFKRGTMFHLRWGNRERGVIEKKKVPEHPGEISHMRNCMTFDIVIPGKVASMKIWNNQKEQNSKLHMTGCKSEAQARICVLEFWRRLERMERRALRHEQPPYFNLTEGTIPSFVFKTSMVNINFSLGFPVDRNKFDHVVNSYEDPISFCEPTITANVNVSMAAHMNRIQHLRKIEVTPYLDHEPIRRRIVLGQEPASSFPDKKRKDKHHTFLVFQSGNVIMSSPCHCEMEEIYDQFIEIIRSNVDRIKERVKV